MSFDFYVPKYRSEYIQYLTQFVCPSVLRKMDMKSLRSRYFAIRFAIKERRAKCI